MDEASSEQIISLLESIDSHLAELVEVRASLDSIQNDISEMKMDISGFTYEGNKHPGSLELLQNGLTDIESIIDRIDTNLTQ